MSLPRLRSCTLSLATLVLLSACSDAPKPTEQPIPMPSAAQLPGQPTAQAITAVPDSTFRPRSQDYTTGHPDLPGMRVSFNTALVGIRPTATVGGVNNLLRQVGATIVGGMPGTATGAGGVLALRLTTTTHAAMSAALIRLRAAPEVMLAVSDIVVNVDRVTPDGSDSALWLWTLGDVPGNPDYGTWGLAAIRMPQTWNLNAHIAASGNTVPTGVLDDGFDPTQEDLLGVKDFVGVRRLRAHGTLVSSIIAAGFDNGRGMDGTNPFARLVFGSTPGETVNDTSMTTGAVAWGLFALLNAHPELRVVNVSLGYNWIKQTPSLSTRTSAEARARADGDGALLDLFLQAVEERQPLPVIVASAGNDHGDSAQYSSMFANAAIRRNVAAIVVVEADTALRDGPVTRVRRSGESNVGGHLSAPGALIGAATTGVSNYGLVSGTSVSAPFVSGLIGYLIALEPGLPRPTRRANVIRDIMVRTAATAGQEGGQRQLDAFAAALELDVQTGTERVLRRLLDVDDGTADGNTRIEPFSTAVVLTNDVAKDTLINMADFRRWRDGMLRLDFPGVTNFDGAEDHPKKDLNGDGRVSIGTEENIFPFADFNGDGQLSRTARAKMPGVLAPRGEMTDLEVFQSRFIDPDYQPNELESLVTSGEIHVRTRGCVPATGERVRIRVSRTSGGFEKSHIFAAGDSQYVWTVPVRGTPTSYTVRTSRIDTAGTELVGRDTTLQVTLGGDLATAGGCAQAVVTSVTITPNSLGMFVGSAVPFEARALDASGAIVTGRIVQWSSTNPAVASVETDVSTSGLAMVRSLAPGTTTIRARVSGVQGTASVAVSTQPLRLSSVALALISDLDVFFFNIQPKHLSVSGGTGPYIFSLEPGAAFFSAITLSRDGVLTGSCQALMDITINRNRFFNNELVNEPVTVKIRVRDATGLTNVQDVQVQYARTKLSSGADAKRGQND